MARQMYEKISCSHVEVWLQALLRDNWVQGDVPLYGMCLIFCVIMHVEDFKQLARFESHHRDLGM